MSGVSDDALAARGQDGASAVLIKGVALALSTDTDGRQQLDGPAVDILVESGIIRRIASVGSLDADGADIIDAEGLVALPGFIDLYAHLREPGPGGHGNLASESTAALGAGFSHVLCAPDTTPVIDSTATLELILHRAEAAGGARILPIAALTQGLEGQILSELATLARGGCVAAGQADRPIEDAGVLLSALEYAHGFGIPLIMTARDARLGAGGCAHDGAVATRLGLPGVPVAAETVALARLLELVRECGSRLHVSRVSSARAVELIAEARRDGLPVTADVGIHHLFFTENDIEGYDARFRSAVPFRSLDDRAALRTAVVQGVVDAICSDHAPLDRDSRLAPFPACSPGLSAYDHFLPLLLALPALLDRPFSALLPTVTSAPAKLIGLDGAGMRHTLSEGSVADLMLIDPADTDVKAERAGLSAGRNTPLDGLDDLAACTGERAPLGGRVACAMVAGAMVAPVGGSGAPRRPG